MGLACLVEVPAALIKEAGERQDQLKAAKSQKQQLINDLQQAIDGISIAKLVDAIQAANTACDEKLECLVEVPAPLIKEAGERRDQLKGQKEKLISANKKVDETKQ